MQEQLLDIDEEVKAAFAAWQEQRSLLQQHSQLLEAALQHYADGMGPLPSQLMADVRAYRRECDDLFKVVLASVGKRDAARRVGKPSVGIGVDRPGLAGRRYTSA